MIAASASSSSRICRIAGRCASELDPGVPGGVGQRGAAASVEGVQGLAETWLKPDTTAVALRALLSVVHADAQRKRSADL
jgi:hypothetical protein